MNAVKNMRTILCIDDEINILNALKRTLYDNDVKLLVTTKSEEALAMMREYAVSIVISDQRMPGIKGTDLLRRIKEEHPDVIRVLISGQTSPEDLVDAINVSEIFRFIAKPWNDDVLRGYVAQCFERQDVMAREAADKNAEKTTVLNEVLGYAVGQWNMPLIATDLKERVLFYTPSLVQALPSLACIHKGVDLKSFIDPGLLRAVRLQVKNPGVEILEPVCVDGYLVRPQVQIVEGAGYLIMFSLHKNGCPRPDKMPVKKVSNGEEQ